MTQTKEYPKLEAVKQEIDSIVTELMEVVDASLDEIRFKKSESTKDLAMLTIQELNKHLTAIHGYSQVVMHNLDGHNASLGPLQNIKACSEEAVRLTRMLFCLSKNR